MNPQVLLTTFDGVHYFVHINIDQESNSNLKPIFISWTVMGGAVSHGFQYELVLKYGHLLQKSAYNFCYGSFGKVKGNFKQHFSYRCFIHAYALL